MPVDFFECPPLWRQTGHNGIRRTVSLHSEHVYNDNVWVETSVKINYIIVLYSDVL